MNTLTVPEDGSELSELIDRVLGGEQLVISRRGRPVATLRSVRRDSVETADRLSAEAAAWLETYPLAGSMPEEDAGAFVSRMRDEDAH